MLVVACSCSSHTGSTNGEANQTPHASSTPSGTNAPPVASETTDAPFAGALDFTLINFTRSNLHAIYVSSHDSEGWEENVLGRDQLFDGDIVKIRFNPQEKAVKWDLRVEDENGYNAEWKELNLREISRITIRRGNGIVMAEAE
jgi:hypothetical protein